MSSLWSSLRRLSPLRSLRDFVRGADPRELQRHADLHRLYLYTQLHARLPSVAAAARLPQAQPLPQPQPAAGSDANGGSAAAASPGGAAAAGLAEAAAEIVGRAGGLSAAQLEASVQASLRAQLVGIAAALHEGLRADGDPTPAAAALEAAARRIAAGSDAGGSGSGSGSGTSSSGSSTSTSSGGSGLQALGRAGDDSSSTSTSTGSTSTSTTSSGSSTSTSSARPVPQARAAELLRARLGYAAYVAPSTIAHADAGLGLFVSGAVPPGALVALFPGLSYAKASYRRMHGYPKVDRGNPYLVAAYDGRVTDSRPWGRGWLPPSDGNGGGGSGGAGRPASAAAAFGAAGAAAARAPEKKGYLRRVMEHADRPHRDGPPPATEWVEPTTHEAAALERLEGRHPLALAHYANHATRALPPNAAVAPVRFKLRGWREWAAAGGGDDGSDGGDGGGSGGSSEPPWLRAYVPFLPYADDPGAAPHLLDEEAAGVGLVAIAPLADGDEVVFDYRLSPGLGRPAWYTPWDEAAEDRRWAPRRGGGGQP